MYHEVQHSQIVRPTYTLYEYLCVLCGSQNKQRLFPYSILRERFFITDTECVYCAVRIGPLDTIQTKLSL